MVVQTIQKAPIGARIKQQLNWGAYPQANQNIVGLNCEKKVLETVYHVPPEQITVVPLGLSGGFLEAKSGCRSQSHLITTGTICPVKHSVELAEMAQIAQVPILFVGKPYNLRDPYWLRFQQLIDNQWVKYQPHVNEEQEMIALLQAARGFVLMSQFENWSLSTHEAVACGLPLLVQDQKWSRERFGSQARFFPALGVNDTNQRILKQFYAETPQLPAPDIKLHSWRDVASDLKRVYEKVLAG
jgi:glycosyltransferase involved in cell wall biosynthesis